MEIRYHKSFQKQYKKLHQKIQLQTNKRLLLFEKNKHNKLLNNHSVDGVYPNCRSINITGDYRAIYTEQESVIVFILIGTHSELY